MRKAEKMKKNIFWKNRGKLLLVTVLSCVSVYSSLNFAQQRKQKKKTTANTEDFSVNPISASAIIGRAETRQNEANYLEKFIATELANKEGRTVAGYIRRLYIMTSNFGPRVSGSKESYNRVITDFKSSTKFLQKGKYVAFLVLQDHNKLTIDRLYRKFMEVYKEDATKLSDEAIDKFADFRFNFGDPANLSVGFSARMEATENVLKRCYKLMARAERSAMARDYFSAIFKYRLAKFYAINVLKRLADEPEAKSKIEQDYEVHIRDYRNLVGDKIAN